SPAGSFCDTAPKTCLPYAARFAQPCQRDCLAHLHQSSRSHSCPECGWSHRETPRDWWHDILAAYSHSRLALSPEGSHHLRDGLGSTYGDRDVKWTRYNPFVSQHPGA